MDLRAAPGSHLALAWRRVAAAIAVTLVLALAGCGQTGALYLPGDDEATPVEDSTSADDADDADDKPADPRP